MYKKVLQKLNYKAIYNGDIPVSCIIVKENKIISKAYNTKYKSNDPLGHAEINAIKKASKKLHTTNLIDCEMYVTLKPCKMCEEIIKESRLKKVNYYLERNKEVNNIIDYKKLDDIDNFFEKELSKFFKNKR